MKLLGLLLAGCALAGSSPKYEYDSTDLSVTRTTTGYNYDWTSFASNTKRSQVFPLSTRQVIYRDTSANRTPMAVDSSVGKILLAQISGSTLVTTTEAAYGDGSSPTYTTVFNVTEQTEYTVGLGVYSAVVLDDGSWLVSTGKDAAAGYIYRSTNKGTSWTMVLEMARGHVRHFGWSGIRGAEIIIGEYTLKDPADTAKAGRTLYYSNDYGATWEAIYNHTARVNMHIHCATFGTTTNTIYFGVGDDTMEVCKITKEADWTADEGATVVMHQNATQLFYYGGYIYVGYDGTADYATIIRLDPATDTHTPVLSVQDPSGNASYPYLMGQSTVFCFKIMRYNGVFWAAVVDTTEDTMGGIYCSIDGTNWTCVARIGAVDFEGVSNIVAMGSRLWGGTAYDESFNNNYPFYMTLPTVTAQSWALAEKSMSNLFVKSSAGAGQYSADDSMFATSVGGWNNGGAALTIAWDNTVSLFGSGGSLKATTTSTTSRNIMARTLTDLGMTFATNDVVHYSAWVKADTEMAVIPQFNATLGNGTGGFTFSSASAVTKVSNGWTKLSIWMTVNDHTLINYSDMLVVRLSTPPSGASLWIGAAQLVRYPAAAKHFYSSSTFYPGGNGAAAISRGDEYGAFNFSTGATFSSTLVWRPYCGYLDLGVDIPVATWISRDGSYIYLKWQQADSKFVLTDGTNSVSSANAYTFQKFDTVRIGLVTDGTNSTLYIGSNVIAATGDANYETVAGTNVNMGIPTSLYVGTNNDATVFGTGLFTQMRIWGEALTEANIAESFSTLSGMSAAVYRSRYSGDYRSRYR
jgi:hypothetical protein